MAQNRVKKLGAAGIVTLVVLGGIIAAGSGGDDGARAATARARNWRARRFRRRRSGPDRIFGSR